MKTRVKFQRAICFIAFSFYILTVLNLTIVRYGFRYDERQLNLLLFVDLIKTYRNVGIGEFLRLFFGNIGWFVPFGFLLPILLKERSLLIITVLSFSFSLAIEIIQHFTRKGVAELDDLLLNILGAIIGYFMYKLLCNVKIFQNFLC